MHKGIVIEMKEQIILIMTPDGQFKQIAKQERSCQLGEEISFMDTFKKPLLNWRSPGPFAIAAASVFCIMIVALLSIFSDGISTNKVVAYVTMDINPSIEVGIDKEEKVIEIRGINNDGVELLKDVVYKGLSLDAFSDLIVQKIELGHYFDNGKTNIIIASTVMNKEQKNYEVELAEKVKTKFIAAINKTHTAPKEEIIVTAITAPQEVRKEAVAQGVSTGKKAVQLLTQKNNKSTTDEDLKEKPIQQMIAENGGIDKIVPKDHKVTKEEFKSLLKEQRDKKKSDRKKDESKKDESKKDETKKDDNKNNQSKEDESKNDESENDESELEKKQRQWAREHDKEQEKMWENMQEQLKEKLKEDQRKEKELEDSNENDNESNNQSDQDDDRNGRSDRSDQNDRNDRNDRSDRNDQNDQNDRDDGNDRDVRNERKSDDR
ncbi:MAG: anti-sigma factor domain-containing protein [Paenibacillaceae bacterium]